MVTSLYVSWCLTSDLFRSCLPNYINSTLSVSYGALNFTELPGQGLASLPFSDSVVLKIGIIAGGETEAPKDRKGSNKKIRSKHWRFYLKKFFLMS